MCWEAYARLIYDAMMGDQTLFSHADGVLVERELKALLGEAHPGAGPLAAEGQRQPRRLGQVEGEVIGAVAPTPEPAGTCCAEAP